MEIVLRIVQRPVRRLRKSLKCLPPDPSIEAVHDLRTATRRVEAVVAALQMGEEKAARRMLRTIKAIRRAAGAVRDMDVLAGKLMTLARDHHDDSLLRLLHHLHDLRIENARELVEAVGEHRKEARRGMKLFSRLLEEWLGEKVSGRASRISGATLRQTATGLLNELKHWPELNAGNLHDFRIKVKELRYVLQLAEGAGSGLVEALEKAREEIGEWHDWLQLARIAEKTLDPQADSAALERINETRAREFSLAMQAADAVRAVSVAGPKPVATVRVLAPYSRTA